MVQTLVCSLRKRGLCLSVPADLEHSGRADAFAVPVQEKWRQSLKQELLARAEESEWPLGIANQLGYGG
jgi:hypothetical protein